MSDDGYGSKREELKLSKSSPLHPTERTSMGRVVTSLMGQKPSFDRLNIDVDRNQCGMFERR
jgi:hypothetical protein